MSHNSKVLKEGWATKQGGFIKTWHRRWFVLMGKTLEYSKQPGVPAQGQILLDEVNEIAIAFQCKKGPALQLVTAERTYFMVFDTAEEVQEWIDVLKKAKNGGGDEDQTVIKFSDFKTMQYIYQGINSSIVLVKHIPTGNTYIGKRYSKKVVGEQNELIENYKKNYRAQDSKFLVKLFDIVTSDDTILFLMEKVDNSLKTALDHVPLSTDLAFSVFSEIIAGLKEIHQRGFFYGDFHIGNVLLDKTGHVKLTLPGIVMDIGENQERNLAYLDPLALEKGKLQKGFDFYSAGVILFEMLAGYPPFISHNRNTLLEDKKSCNISFPPQIIDAHKQMLRVLMGSDAAKREALEIPPPVEGQDMMPLLNGPQNKLTEVNKAFDSENFEDDPCVINYAEESAIMQAI